MMNQFGLIIQETTAGSGQQFVSAHLDVNNPEIKETITDERFIATQLANLTDVYSVQVTKNYKVYSLIVTDLADFLGRSGYYAIRLYGPKGVNLTNFESILASIKEKYNSYTKSNSLNNQNYDAILSSILIIENDRKSNISLKNDINCFYYFEETNTTLSTVFNTKGVNLVHKIYAFNKEKALDENSAASLGLKAYSPINSSQKEINIINNHRILKELKINNQTIDFNPNVSDFNLICRTSDAVVYNTTDDKNYRQIDNTFQSIEKKHVPRPVPKPKPYPGNGRRKKTFWEENGVYLGILLLTIMIAGSSWWFLARENEPSTIKFEQTETTTIITDTIKKIEFEFDGPTQDSVFKTSYPKLDIYRFKFEDGDWSYKKDNQKYGEFYIEDIQKIIDNNHLTVKVFSDDFKIKLKEKSGHEVENKPKDNNSTTLITRKTTTGKPPSTGNSGEVKPIDSSTKNELAEQVKE